MEGISMNLYRIERITDHAGNDRTGGKYPQRVGREGHLMPLTTGQSMAFTYEEPDCGTLVTSPIMFVSSFAPGVKVQTRHSIYYFTAVESGEETWPEPIDWEDEYETV